VTLAGGLEVSLLNGYTPHYGDSFVILSSGSTISGMFSSVTAGFEANLISGNTAVELICTQLLLGDMNGNGEVDGYDITPFVMALTDREQYLIDYPGIDPAVVGDINASGSLDGYDITLFVQLLTGSPEAPEPTAALLLGLGTGLTLLHRRRRRT